VIDFTHRRALVTGASRGIGAAVARRLAALGGTIAVHCNTNRAAADEVVASLDGEGHTVVQADIADADAVERMVAEAVDALGGIDVLVNNAAIYEEHAIASVSYEAWQRAWRNVIDTNLIGTANVTYCVVRHMLRAGGGGRIVNVSSRGAFRGEPDFPAYGASKAALNSMGQSLALALGGSGIYITTVAPGYVETDMAAEYLDGPKGDSIRAQSPLGRVATPDEVASVVAFLASPAADFATGTIVDVNGASYLRS
jgi:NAD(P)-dependent dehydrogenase (short-subunit alcohol dehydrogenase family)